jgi:hypothetical protein
MPRQDSAYTLGEFRETFVFIACWHCPRRGRYRVANIVAKYGPDMHGTSLLNVLSADCTHYPPMSTIRVCGAHFTDTMWRGEGPKPR